MSGIIEKPCNAGGDSCQVGEIQGKIEIHPETDAAPGIGPVDGQTEIDGKKESSGDGSLLLITLEERTKERDAVKKALAETEAKLSGLQASYNEVISGNDDQMSLRRDIESFKVKLDQAEQKLKERSRLISNQECQISALVKQVSSLKEVVAITKSLLEIRNMEVKHLQENVDGMEAKISAERSRHDEMISRLNATAKLNADLKTEYETQLHLFKDLRKKYEEKVSLLASEKEMNGTANSCSK